MVKVSEISSLHYYSSLVQLFLLFAIEMVVLIDFWWKMASLGTLEIKDEEAHITSHIFLSNFKKFI